MSRESSPALLLLAIFVLLQSPDVSPDSQDSCKGAPLISGSRHRVEDYQLTASQTWFGYGLLDHGAARSRLDASRTDSGRAGAWSANTNALGQWIQVDVRKTVNITAIATRGRNSSGEQWVSSYEVQYSEDGITWTSYMEGGKTKVFVANKDKESTVRNALRPAISARFVRLYPVTWHHHISLRWEVYGCLPSDTGCSPEALISGHAQRVLDEQLTASSSWTSHDHSPPQSRMDAVQTPSLAGAWCVYTNTRGHWIQVDFEEEMLVTDIGTKGRQGEAQWVKSYKLKYSNDSISWTWYATGATSKVFAGNRDISTEVKHHLERSFTARYVRLYPLTWYIHTSLRWEVYGCPLTDGGVKDAGSITRILTVASTESASVSAIAIASRTPVNVSTATGGGRSTTGTRTAASTSPSTAAPVVTLTQKTSDTHAAAGGLTSGTVAGIVIGILVAVAMLSASLFLMWRRRLGKQDNLSFRFITLENN